MHPNYSQAKVNALACLLIIRKWRFNLILWSKPPADSFPHAQPFRLTPLAVCLISRLTSSVVSTMRYGFYHHILCSQTPGAHSMPFLGTLSTLTTVDIWVFVFLPLVLFSEPSSHAQFQDNGFHLASSDLIWCVNSKLNLWMYVCVCLWRFREEMCVCVPVFLAFIVRVLFIIVLVYLCVYRVLSKRMCFLIMRCYVCHTQKALKGNPEMSSH